MLKDRAILTLSLSQTLVWAGLFYIFPASLLRWETALGWSKTDLTLAITIATLASALGAPVAGRIIDRGYGPVMMGAAPAIGGLCVVALSQVTALWQFYVLWLVIGLMLAGSLYDACFSLVTHSRGAGARRGIVFITLVAGFAGTISFPTVFYLSEAMGWRAATALIGAVIAFGVAPMQWLGARALQNGRVPPPPQLEAHQRPKNFLRRPVFWLLGAGFAALAIVHGATLQHLLPLLNERGLPAEFAILIAALIGPMQVAGRLLMVATERFLDTRQFMLAAFAVMGTSITLLLISGDTRVVIFAFVLLFGSGWGTVSILRPVIVRDILGQENFGAKSGSLALLFLTAAAASAYLGALIWGIGGYGAMLGVLIVLAIMGAVSYITAHRLSQQGF